MIHASENKKQCAINLRVKFFMSLCAYFTFNTVKITVINTELKYFAFIEMSKTLHFIQSASSIIDSSIYNNYTTENILLNKVFNINVCFIIQ